MTTSEAEGTSTRSRVPADTFAGRLMLVRLHAGGLTIQEAAARCGLLNQSWSNWERGRRPRDLIEVVQAISDEFDIDRDWLLFGGPLSDQRRRRVPTDQLPARPFAPGIARPSRADHRPANRHDSTRPAGRPSNVRRRAVAA